MLRSDGRLAIEGSYRVARQWFQGRWPLWAAICLDLINIPLATALVWGSLTVIAPHVMSYVNVGDLFIQNCLIFTLIRMSLLALALRRDADLEGVAPTGSAAATDDHPVQARLPFALKGAEILALSAEDHYLRVFTVRGEALIHLSLNEAIAGQGGFQIHRSHWISGRALKDYDSRHVYLSNSTSFPISRHRRRDFVDWLTQSGIRPA